MNARARIKRLELSIRGRCKMDPEHISGALAFLWSGDAADIPDGLNLAELQAAARMIHADKAAVALGLDKVRAALGDECGGDVLGHIARMNPTDAGKPWRIVWPEGYENKAHVTAGDWLLARLGFGKILILSYQGDEIDAEGRLIKRGRAETLGATISDHS